MSLTMTSQKYKNLSKNDSNLPESNKILIRSLQMSFIIDKSSQSNIFMKSQSVQSILRKETAKWYDLNKTRGYNSQYCKIMYQIVSSRCNTQITFDSRFADAIHFCINQSFCTDLGQQPLDKPDLEIYVKMAKQLYEQSLISKRHLSEIEKIKPFNMVCKINHFLIKKNLGKFSPKDMEQMWLEMFGISIVHFWQLLLQKRIKSEIIKVLYESIKKVPSICQLRKQRKMLLIDQQQHFDDEQRHLIPENLKITKEEEEIKRDNIVYNWDQFRRKEGFQQPNLQQLRPVRNADINSYLENISFDHSLFKNPKFKSEVQSIKKFIFFFRQNILKDKGYELNTFGSLRSTFALSSQYDIDLTFLSPKASQNQRFPSIHRLQEIRRQIIAKSFKWLKQYSEPKAIADHYQLKLFTFQGMPIPLLKIQIDPDQFKRVFRLQNISKIDVTIGNKSAIINSQILLHYAKVPQISSFCILVKLWAKSRKVINIDHPMHGLSSYVLNLMCLYYLMHTNQIEFLEVDPKKLKKLEISSIIPNLQRIKLSSISQNFEGFLQFYGKRGKFISQQRVVCLLEGKLPETFNFNPNYIINVYDFVDESNPGRLQMKYKDHYFRQFQRALQLLKSKDIHKVSQIFEKI